MTCAENPHIGLRAKLSRAFSTTHVLVILFLVFNLANLLATLFPREVEIMKRELMAPCRGIEAATSALTVELPRQVVYASRNIIGKTLTTLVKNSGKILAGGVHILNLIILQIIHRYQRLLLCFLQAVFQSSIGALQSNAQKISDAVNAQLKTITAQMNNNINQGTEKFKLQSTISSRQ